MPLLPGPDAQLKDLGRGVVAQPGAGGWATCASVCRHPEHCRVPGADFTNTFYVLSSFPVGPEALGLPEFLAALTAQCASLEELKLAFRPQMDPRWVPGSHFLEFASRGRPCRPWGTSGRAGRGSLSREGSGPRGRDGSAATVMGRLVEQAGQQLPKKSLGP